MPAQKIQLTKIIDLCKRNKINFYVGSEDNVLKRFYKAAIKFNISNIVRITSDCPLVDGSLVDELLNKYTQKKCDYASNVIYPTFPDGLDVEVFNFNALRDRYLKTINNYEKEHVTVNLKSNKNYKRFNLELEKNFSKIRITLDNNYDLYIIDKLFKKFNYNFKVNYKKILKLCENNNNFFEKNSLVKRNQNLNIGQKYWIRAKNIIPGGTMLFSKNPDLQLPIYGHHIFLNLKTVIFGI